MAVLRCIKTFYMNDGVIAFFEGVDYPISAEETIEGDTEYEVTSELDHCHLIPWDDETMQHFKVVKEDQ